MNNPFHDSFENAFRGHRVTATSSNGETYTGVVERLHHHDRHVVLRAHTAGRPMIRAHTSALIGATAG